MYVVEGVVERGRAPGSEEVRHFGCGQSRALLVRTFFWRGAWLDGRDRVVICVVRGQGVTSGRVGHMPQYTTRSAPTGSRCKFLLADEEQKLSTIFSNYLSLGQFELARGIFQRLRKYPSATELLDTLIVLGPPKDWLCSISVPSSAHLGWLCVTLREELEEHRTTWGGGTHQPSSPTSCPRVGDSRSSSNSSSTGAGSTTAIPDWTLRQLELDILLTTALLDGAANGWQSLSPGTVKILRTVFFLSLPRETLSSITEHRPLSRRVRECYERAVSQLSSLHVLPIPGFLPPVASYLHEQKVTDMFPGTVASLSSVTHHLKELMLSQPLVGFAVWKELASSVSGSAPHQSLLQTVAVQLLAQCFHDRKFRLALFFLRCLRPPAKNAAMDEGVRDILTAIIDLIWDRQFRLLESGGLEKEAYSLPTLLKERLMALSGTIVATGFVGKEGTGSASAVGALPRREVYESLLISDDTHLLSYYCSIEDANSRLRLESVELPPCFTHFHQRLRNKQIDNAYSTFWGDYFTLMWVTKQHCLEYVLKNGLRFIQQQNFEAASDLLKPFEPLQALVILLSIDDPSVADITAKQRLISALWSQRENKSALESQQGSPGKHRPASEARVDLSSCSEPRVERWCDQLAFMVKLAWWYTDRYATVDVDARVPASVQGVWRADEHLTRGASFSHRVANAVLEALETNSVVRVVRECLPSIPDAVVPGSLMDGADLETARDQLGFGLIQFLANRPRGTSQINEEHQQDMMLLRSYYALKNIFTWFHNALVAERRVSRKVREMPTSAQQRELERVRAQHLEVVVSGSPSVKKLFLDIVSLPIRLTALENAFALLFLRNNDSIDEAKTDEVKRATGMTRRNSRPNLSALGSSVGAGSDNDAKTEGGVKLEDISEAFGLSGGSNKDSGRLLPLTFKENGQYNLYIASAGMLKILLSILKDCLEDTKEKLNDKQVVEGDEWTRSFARTERLLQYVEEGVERVVVLEASENHFKRSSSQFMKRMFATPQSLLNVCLKRSDYVLAKRMIDFFKIANARSNEVILAETLDRIAASLSALGKDVATVDTSFTKTLLEICTRGASGTTAPGVNDISASVSSQTLSGQLHAFYMTVDLAVSAAPTIRQSHVLLKHAQTLLQTWRDDWMRRANAPGAMLEDVQSKLFLGHLFKYFSTFIINRYGKLIKNENKLAAASGVSNPTLPPLWKLLKQVENMPIDAEHTILESHLSQVQSRVQALDNLRAVFDRVRIGAKGKASELKMESFLESVLEQFSQGNQQTKRNSLPALASAGNIATSEDELEMQYLANFLTYIMEISNGLKSARNEGEDQKPLDFLSILNSAPRKILSSLVLEFNGFSEARNLAHLMRIDLLRVLLRSCCHTSILKDYTTKSRGGKNVLRETHTNNDPRYPLNMKVVEYVATLEKESSFLGSASQPLLASLVCMQRWTNPPSTGKFISYALAHTVHFPSLHRWVCSRAQAFSHFMTIFFDIEGDEGASETEGTPPPARLVSDPVSDFISFDAAGFQGWEKSKFGTKECSRLDDEQLVNVFVPRDPRLCLCLQNLYEDDALSDSHFYEMCVDQLKKSGKLTHALALADGAVQHGSKIVEGLLESLIKKGADGSAISRYIKRMRNHVHAANLALEHLERFDVDTGIDLLYMCAFQLESGDAGLASDNSSLKSLHSRICASLFRLKTYKSILVVNPGAYFTSWQMVGQMCRENPADIVRRLLAVQEHQLAGSIMSQVSLGENLKLVRIEFETSYILELLMKQNDKSKAFERLEALEAVESARVCQNVFQQIDDHQTKLILIQFLINVSENIGDSKVAELQSVLAVDSLSVVELSLNILVRLPRNLSHRLHHLIGKPTLIVESLLMSCHISLVNQLLTEYPTLLNNGMIFTAAQKALSLKQHGQYRQNILTGVEEEDVQIRLTHVYAETPNMVLAKSIMDIMAGHDLIGAGKACFWLCDRLSLSLRSSDNSTMILGMLRHLLVYAKKQFDSFEESGMVYEPEVVEEVTFGVKLLGTGASGLSQQCDAYRSCCTLLRTLQSMEKYGAAGFDVSLTDMSNPIRMRKLRDALVTPRIDRIRLALDVCHTCCIEEEPVYSAWGLALVRMGEFGDAREKFAACLPRLESKEVKLYVRQIVAIIKNGALHPCGLDDLQKRHIKSSFKVLTHDIWKAKPTRKKALTSTTSTSAEKYGVGSTAFSGPAAEESHSGVLSDSLRDECLHYLQAYGVKHGDSEELVDFYMSQGLLNDACRVIVAQHLPTSVFVDIVVTACVKRSQVVKLQDVLGHIDGSLTIVRPYVIGMCSWLHDHEEYQLLRGAQVFMKDHIGAAFTCERLFDAVRGFDERMENLRQAKEHFTAALSQTVNSRVSLLSLEGASEMGMTVFAGNDTAIRGRIRLVEYQMSILKLFPAKQTYSILAIGVAMESETTSEELRARRMETVEEISSLDPHLGSILKRTFGSST